METIRLIACMALALLAPRARAQGPAPLRVRLGYASAMHGELASVLGHRGLGGGHGLDIETTYFEYGPPQIAALVSGNLDVSFTSIVPTATYLAKRPGAVTVIAYLGDSSHGLVVPPGSPIHSFSDLTGGKTLGAAFGTDSYVDLLASLKAAGLSAGGDVRLINIPPSGQPAALESGLADAVLLRQPQLDRYRARGYRVIRSWPHHLWVIARTDWLRQHPGVREALLLSLADGVRYEAKHPAQAAGWFSDVLRLPRVVLKEALPPRFGPSGTIALAVPLRVRRFAEKRARQLVEFGLAGRAAVFPY